MTTSEVAKALSVSRITAWRMARDGVLISARRVGNGRGHFDIDPREVRGLLRGQPWRRA